MKKRSSRILNLPNWLSLIRIGAMPVLILLLLFGQGGKFASIAAAIVFLLAILTDLLDGVLARRYKLITNLGRFLDPLADKLLNSTALIMLIPLARAPAWLVVLIIGREIAVTGLRSMAAAQGVVIAASRLGKQKTLIQNVAIFLLLWHYSFYGLNFHLIGLVLLFVALIVTWWSGYLYVRDFYRVLEQDVQKGVDNSEEK